MKAVCWYGDSDVRVENVADPKILSPGDVIIKVTSTAICGSDLHLYHNYIPGMKRGDILGHEFMGEVVELGKNVKRLKQGDRVVVPFTISCGACHYCKQELFSLCDNTNPNAWMAEIIAGFSGAGIYGYSHLYGGYAGGQAEYVRVPFADSGPLKIQSDLEDDQVLFLSDIFPTGYMAVEVCNIRPGHVVAVWGCGPVGQFAIRSARILGAHKIIAIDNNPVRLLTAAQNGAIVLSSDDNVHKKLKDLTGGRGPDACVDCVGMEAHGSTYDFVKQKLLLENDRAYVLRQAIRACRKGGVVSVPGVYSGFHDKMPFGAAFAKGLTIKTGQTHVQRYMPLLLQSIERGEIDPSFVITHRMPLEDAAKAYQLFAKKQDHCLKVVLKPTMDTKEDDLQLAGRDRVSGGKQRDDPLLPREDEEQSRTE
jgi:threonine dehydrogenase-like Zn-dependent dehydrogenase